MIRKSTVIAALFALCVLDGCGTSPKETFYTLSAPEQPPAKALYTVVVGPLTVPEVVDRPQMVLRTGANQVEIAEQSRWASPLKSEIARVIAANLAQLLSDALVSSYPEGMGSEADYRVVVDIQRFESAPGAAATIEALWSVRSTKDKDGTPHSGRSLVSVPAPGDYDALVAAHGRALASISKDIAEAIRAERAAQ